MVEVPEVAEVPEIKNKALISNSFENKKETILQPKTRQDSAKSFLNNEFIPKDSKNESPNRNSPGTQSFLKVDLEIKKDESPNIRSKFWLFNIYA